MSYLSPPVYAMNKESDPFGQAFVDPCNDFFDQFLTFDSIDNDNSTFTIRPDATDLVKSNSTDAGTTSSPLAEEDLLFHPSPPPDSWDLDQNPASPQLGPTSSRKQFYSEDSGRAATSDTLLSLGDIHLRSSPQLSTISPSLPSSPTKPTGGSLRRTKRFIRSISRAFPDAATGPPVPALPRVPPVPRDSDCRQRSPIRKATSPAKMMRASQYSEQNLQEWSDRLAQDAVKFDFGFQDPMRPLSPPPSARVSEASNDSSNGIMGHDVQGAFTWDHPVPQYATRPVNLHTPQTTPLSDVHDFHQQQSVQQVSSSGMVYPQQAQVPSTAWMAPQAEFDSFAPHSPFVDENETAPIWWNHAATVPVSQPAPASFHRNPTSHDTKSLAMQLQSELAFNANELALSPSSMPSGLMIQMPQISPHHQQPFVLHSPLSQQQHNSTSSYFTGASPHHPTHSMSANASPRRHHYAQTQPIPSARQFQPGHVRKSRSRNDLQIPDSPSPPSPRTPLTPRSASFHVAKRRSASANRAGKAHPPLPKGSGASSGIEFMNFTPGDSQKILTGVAPSGSSKTKARREKEAMEKRRRLSQAAVRAVQAAGGSIESLVEEGLFV